MNAIRWKPIPAYNIDGLKTFHPPHGFAMNAENHLQSILAMPAGKPISLQNATILFLERFFEIWDQCPATCPGMKPLNRFDDLGIVGYMKSLGYKIVLTGKEYEMI